ncbi:MocR-like pyridoxine biosynthesis transcription factor PdxR [Vallitalea okinawensis]|uniref:MocR-like pyridoxine biosynthesis transcription factor PdxR n=1 Tax=Vallitalea okinawensis TaxID=2078660 RepID=UPI000CFE06F9|nr:PLP-dependent aminotransferase family protein [Vallitalea okinawensis]
MFDLKKSDNEKKRPLYLQLYNSIKKDIQSGQMRSGDKLPSIRLIAKELDISRTTIENAYSQLLMEGYIYSKPQSGYFVAEIERHFESESIELEYTKGINSNEKETKFYDETLFNFKAWKRYLGKAILEYEDLLYTSGESQGEILLRQEIGRYIYKYRGVVCSHDQIIVGAGVQTLLGLLCHILKKRGVSSIGFENPGFTEPHHIFTNNGFKIKYIDVGEKGIEVKQLNKSAVNLSYVSPSHQFPTGAVMPINNRINLINWALKADGLIIEDDYDSELIYKGQPIPSLQGLDQGERVIYLGSFSTLFLPAIRISYMVLPKQLIEEYYPVKEMYNPTVSKLEQIALALYMGDGEFEKHIRRVKKIFAKKNEKLIMAIEEKLGDEVEIMNGDCGVYLIMKLIRQKDMTKIIEGIKEKNIPINTMAHYRKNHQNKEQILVLKYRNIPEKQINIVIQALSDIIRKH